MTAAAAIVAKSKSQDGVNLNAPNDAATAVDTADTQTADTPQVSEIDLTQPTYSQPKVIEQGTLSRNLINYIFKI